MKDIKYQQSFQSLNDYGEQIREIVQGRMKSAVLDMVYQLFEDELHFLCGPRYDRFGECSRAGSDPGSIYVNGQRVLIKKPIPTPFPKIFGLKSSKMSSTVRKILLSKKEKSEKIKPPW